MRRWGGLAVLAWAFVVGCGGDGGEPSDTAIADVVVSDDGLALLVRIGGDGIGGSVSADESSDEVRLSGTSIEEDCPPNAQCTGLVVPVYLDQPLGDRRLIDATTGNEIDDVVRCDNSPRPVDAGQCEATTEAAPPPTSA